MSHKYQQLLSAFEELINDFVETGGPEVDLFHGAFEIYRQKETAEAGMAALWWVMAHHVARECRDAHLSASIKAINRNHFFESHYDGHFVCFEVIDTETGRTWEQDFYRGSVATTKDKKQVEIHHKGKKTVYKDCVQVTLFNRKIYLVPDMDRKTFRMRYMGIPDSLR